MTERLAVNISDVAAASVRRLMERNGHSATETVRRAIALLERIDRADDDGYELQLVHTRTGEVCVITLIR